MGWGVEGEGDWLWGGGWRERVTGCGVGVEGEGDWLWGGGGGRG